MKHKYLIELVSLCVRHLRHDSPGLGQGNQQMTPYQFDYNTSTLRTFVKNQEADIFVPEAKFLKKFFVEAKRNRSM